MKNSTCIYIYILLYHFSGSRFICKQKYVVIVCATCKIRMEQIMYFYDTSSKRCFFSFQLHFSSWKVFFWMCWNCVCGICDSVETEPINFCVTDLKNKEKLDLGLCLRNVYGIVTWNIVSWFGIMKYKYLIYKSVTAKSNSAISEIIIYLLHLIGFWEIWVKLWTINSQFHFSDQYLDHFLDCPQALDLMAGDLNWLR